MYTERKTSPVDAFLRSHILLSMVLDEPARRTWIAGLNGEDAQCVIDYLDKVRRRVSSSTKRAWVPYCGRYFASGTVFSPLRKEYPLIPALRPCTSRSIISTMLRAKRNSRRGLRIYWNWGNKRHLCGALWGTVNLPQGGLWQIQAQVLVAWPKTAHFHFFF